MVQVRANHGLGLRSLVIPHVWGCGQVASVWSIKWRVINAGRFLRILCLLAISGFYKTKTKMTNESALGRE